MQKSHKNPLRKPSYSLSYSLSWAWAMQNLLLLLLLLLLLKQSSKKQSRRNHKAMQINAYVMWQVESTWRQLLTTCQWEYCVMDFADHRSYWCRQRRQLQSRKTHQTLWRTSHRRNSQHACCWPEYLCYTRWNHSLQKPRKHTQ